MTRTPFLTFIFPFIVLAGFALPASAHYRPGAGRWLERDPIGTMPSMVTWINGATYRLADGSPRIGSGVIRPRTQYRDGMNLYEYSRSNPVTFGDPSGLYVPGKSEFRQAVEHLGVCKVEAIWENSLAAEEISTKKFPSDAKKADAYRHCLWNCFNVTDISRCGGITFNDAKWAADQHEEYGTMNPGRWPEPRHSRETYMDYFNNHWGRLYGLDCISEQKAKSGPCSNSSIAKDLMECCKAKCLKGIDNGTLIAKPTDPPPSWVLPVPPGQTQPPLVD